MHPDTKRVGDLAYQLGWVKGDCSGRGKLLEQCVELMRTLLADKDPDMAIWSIRLEGMVYRIKRELDRPVGPQGMDWHQEVQNGGAGCSR